MATKSADSQARPINVVKAAPSTTTSRSSRTAVVAPTTTVTRRSITNRNSLSQRPLSPSPLSDHNPSKAFLAKCQTAEEALLTQIKGQYQDQLRSLFHTELYTDLKVTIGQFTKPLHRCILAARVNRLYRVLQGLCEAQLVASVESAEPEPDPDIIVSQFQLKDNQTTQPQTEITTDSLIDENETEQRAAPAEYLCCLPSESIAAELFKNFIRRVYLDEDLHDEERNLTARLTDWISSHRPEALKPIAEFGNLEAQLYKRKANVGANILDLSPINDNIARVMSTEPESIDSIFTNAAKAAAAASASTGTLVDFSDTAGNFTSPASMTRTETFEKLSMDLPNEQKMTTAKRHSSVDDGSTVSNIAQQDSSHDDERSDYGADISSTEGSGTHTPIAQATNGHARTPRASITRPPNCEGNLQHDIVKKAPMSRTGLKPSTRSLVTKQQQSSSIKSSPSPANSASSVTSASAVKRNVVSSRPGVTKISSSIRATAAPPTTIASTPTMTNSNSSSSSPGRPTPSSVANKSLADNRPITKLSSSPRSSITGDRPPMSRVMARHRPEASGDSPVTGVSPADRRLAVSKRQLKATGGYDSETTIGSELGSETGSLVLDNSSASGSYAQMDRHTLASYSKLAEAMTRMFLDELESDVTVVVKDDGKTINAHRCMLAARSAYMAELFDVQRQQAPNGPQHNTNQGKHVIDLSEYSYAAVYFAIFHMYSGCVKVPDDLELEELTQLAHMLHVHTLRQVCVHNLRMTYCHFFHKPCTGCTQGVLKTLPLAWRYDLSDLYAKCLQWIGAHFAHIFCLKEFAELRPPDLIEECYSATLNQLTPDTIIGRTLECQRLLKNLPQVKWSESIVGLVGRLLEDFCHYVAENYERIITSETFTDLGKNCWDCEILEENLLAAMNHLKPDMGCRTWLQLHKIECSTETFADDAPRFSDSFAGLVSKMRKYCERYLIREAHLVVNCPSWKQMNPALQRKIKEQAVISADFDEPTRPLAVKPKLVSSSRSGSDGASSKTPPLGAAISTTGNAANAPNLNNPSNTKTRTTASPSTCLPPLKTKKIINRHVKVLK